jgi:hypothetical protein
LVDFAVLIEYLHALNVTSVNWGAVKSISLGWRSSSIMATGDMLAI